MSSAGGWLPSCRGWWPGCGQQWPLPGRQSWRPHQTPGASGQASPAPLCQVLVTDGRVGREQTAAGTGGETAERGVCWREHAPGHRCQGPHRCVLLPPYGTRSGFAVLLIKFKQHKPPRVSVGLGSWVSSSIPAPLHIRLFFRKPDKLWSLWGSFIQPFHFVVWFF